MLATHAASVAEPEEAANRQRPVTHGAAVTLHVVPQPLAGAGVECASDGAACASQTQLRLRVLGVSRAGLQGVRRASSCLNWNSMYWHQKPLSPLLEEPPGGVEIAGVLGLDVDPPVEDAGERR